MWRTQAILDLLLGDLAGLHEGDSVALTRARRRGTLIVALDWLAIVVLVVFQDRGESHLSLGPGEQTLFTLGILVVAAHSGYRLAQVHKLRTIERIARDLEERRSD